MTQSPTVKAALAAAGNDGTLETTSATTIIVFSDDVSPTVFFILEGDFRNFEGVLINACDNQVAETDLANLIYHEFDETIDDHFRHPALQAEAAFQAYHELANDEREVYVVSCGEV